MLSINLYGRPTSDYHYMREVLIKYLEKNHTSWKLNEINSIETFINKGILTVPMIELNNALRLTYPGFNIKAYMNKIIAMIAQQTDIQLKHLLVPIDYSSVGNNAAIYAYNMAKAYGLRITFIHAYYPAAIAATDGSLINQELEKVERDRFVNWVENVLPHLMDYDESLDIDAEFIIGFPAREICNLTKDSNASMIVMGRTGGGGASQKLFGSVSKYVAQHSKIPVIVVPHNAMFRRLNRACFAYENKQEDRAELEYVFGIMGRLHMNLDLLHVIDPSENRADNSVVYALDTLSDQQEVNSFIMESESVKEGILKHVGSRDIDMMIMLKKDRSFLYRLLNGSATKAVHFDIDIPLCIIHELD